MTGFLGFKKNKSHYDVSKWLLACYFSLFTNQRPTVNVLNTSFFLFVLMRIIYCLVVPCLFWRVLWVVFKNNPCQQVLRKWSFFSQQRISIIF